MAILKDIWSVQKWTWAQQVFFLFIDPAFHTHSWRTSYHLFHLSSVNPSIHSVVRSKNSSAEITRESWSAGKKGEWLSKDTKVNVNIEHFEFERIKIMYILHITFKSSPNSVLSKISNRLSQIWNIFFNLSTVNEYLLNGHQWRNVLFV